MRFAREAIPFVAPFGILAGVFFVSGRRRLAAAAAGLGGAVLLFFRDPSRGFFGGPDVAIAPADGVVTGIDLVEDPEVGPGRFHRIVTFLSAFDVHVQRVPITGTVVVSRYREGKKVAAFLSHAGEVNQSNLTVIERLDGSRVGIRQIAGLMARQVACYLVPGQDVERGEHLGLIKFGSRVDLLVPEEWEIFVEKGLRLRNGETPVARAPRP